MKVDLKEEVVLLVKGVEPTETEKWKELSESQLHGE